jgi:hypothetical protein
MSRPDDRAELLERVLARIADLDADERVELERVLELLAGGAEMEAAHEATRVVR